MGFALAFCGASLLSGEAQQRKAQEGECVTHKRIGFTSVKPVLFLLLCPRPEGVTSHDVSGVVRRHMRRGFEGNSSHLCETCSSPHPGGLHETSVEFSAQVI